MLDFDSGNHSVLLPRQAKASPESQGRLSRPCRIRKSRSKANVVLVQTHRLVRSALGHIGPTQDHRMNLLEGDSICRRTSPNTLASHLPSQSASRPGGDPTHLAPRAVRSRSLTRAGVERAPPAICAGRVKEPTEHVCRGSKPMVPFFG